MVRVPAIQKLVECLGRLPGIGPKTSERLAYHLLRVDEREAAELAAALRDLWSSTRVCSTCFNLDGSDPCWVCRDDTRDRSTILVVEDPRDVGRFEETGYSGLYHVLQGRVSQIEGIGLEDLTLGALIQRIKKDPPDEVCLATNADLEGEGTARLVAEQLAPSGVAVTRLSRGLPAGSTIAQVSRSILADAVEGRRPL
jgi:recombination protein RecR